MINDILQAIAQLRYRWKSALFSSLGVTVSCLALVISGHLTNMATSAIVDQSKVNDGYTLSIILTGPTNQLSMSDYEDFFVDHPNIISYHPIATSALSLGDHKISIIGSTANSNDIFSTHITSGRPLHTNDVLPYAVITEKLQSYLMQKYQYTHIGSQIINHDGIIEVIGISDEITLPSGLPPFPDGVALVSLETFETLFPTHYPNMLVLKVDDIDHLETVSRFATGMIKDRFPEVHSMPVSPALFLKQAEGGLQIVNYLTYLIVAICAGLGGIGIMNMIIANITHRKTELALRIALGATHQSIKKMLIIETCVLCIISGIIGVSLGLVATMIIAKVADWRFILSPVALLNSMVFSTAVAVLSSQYPASIVRKMPIAYILKGE